MIAGIDPDTTNTGLALILPDGSYKLQLVRAKGRYAEDRFPQMALALAVTIQSLKCYASSPWVAIEWQHIRPRGERNPNSMMGVQAVAGMALCAIMAAFPLSQVECPIPSKWKGSVPKEIHQRRILREAGLTIDSPEFHGIPGSLRHHVIDALGLALWVKKLIYVRRASL